MEQFCREVLGLTDAQLIRAVAALSRREAVKKGELLFRAGERRDELYFLESGLVCGMILDADGQAITDCIAFLPGDPIIPENLSDRLLSPDDVPPSDVPAYYFAEVLEDSALFQLPVTAVIEQLYGYPEVMQLQNRLLIGWTERHWQLKLAKQQMPALERYQWFLKQYPGLAGRLPDRYIASFLGMKPVTLSRLRHSLRAGQA
ncbi:MAG TPA: Crp/Fnr family transcriptional regulator [Candidatus Butyricicoccus stercorigallinarum]|nr:Crp/Fnr family transcriptional regulator [Candidatus Butyricicoccus stercorigallinarum]